MDEQELFDEVINDVSDKAASREVLLLWSAYRRDGSLPEGELKRFRTRFAPYFAEFTAIRPMRPTCRISRANIPRWRHRPVSCGCRPRTCGCCGPDSSRR